MTTLNQSFWKLHHFWSQEYAKSVDLNERIPTKDTAFTAHTKVRFGLLRNAVVGAIRLFYTPAYISSRNLLPELVFALLLNINDPASAFHSVSIYFHHRLPLSEPTPASIGRDFKDVPPAPRNALFKLPCFFRALQPSHWWKPPNRNECFLSARLSSVKNINTVWTQHSLPFRKILILSSNPSCLALSLLLE